MLTVPPPRTVWETSYEVPWFTTVHSLHPSAIESPFIDIWEYLNNWWEMSEFDSERTINKDRVYLATLLIEYTSRDVLDSDKRNNTQLQLKNPIQALPIDGTRQLGQNIGDFEWNWKYYLVVYTYNNLTDETIPERWVYKGVILDMDKYNATKPQSELAESSVMERVKNIFPHN